MRYWREITDKNIYNAAHFSNETKPEHRQMFLDFIKSNHITHYAWNELYDSIEDVPKLLLTGRFNRYHKNTIPNPNREWFSRLDGFDHNICYKNNITGQVWIVYHSHYPTPKLKADVEEWCSANFLYYKFLDTSWYVPDGGTLAIVISGGEIL